MPRVAAAWCALTLLAGCSGRAGIGAAAGSSPSTAAASSPAPLVEADSSRFVVLRYPGAAETIASAINGRGEVVGRFDTPDGRTHGFVWRDGRFEVVDLLGAEFTMIRGINDRGDIVGRFELADGKGVGYLLRAGRR